MASNSKACEMMSKCIQLCSRIEGDNAYPSSINKINYDDRKTEMGSYSEVYS